MRYRRLLAAIVLPLLLAACAGKSKRPPQQEPAAPPAASAPAPAQPSGGGLYAPHIQDSGPALPPDLSAIEEPVPVREPLARYGNRSPYTVLGRSYRVMESAQGYVERGIASWYGEKFHGRPTSSFEPYDMYKLTAAHKTLPLPTYVRVTNLENGRSLVVRVNDRGPFHGDRLIDLSYAAAVKLGVHPKGTAKVEVRAIVPEAGAEPARRAAVSGSGRHWLQVASFGDRDNARRLERRLSEAGIRQHRLQQAKVGGGTVWRVQVGPVESEAESARLETRLRQLGFGTPQRVRD